MPAYNSAKFLPDSIESILSQTYQPYEIIIVDDGSTDNTKEVISRFIQRIKYIRLEQNRGAPAARNIGIQSAQGKYIAFIDADDIWMPEKLQVNVEYLETHSEVGMIYSKHINIDEEGNFFSDASKKQLPSGNIFLRLFSQENFIVTPSVVIREEIFKTIGLFDEQLFNCQDWDMWLRIAFYFPVAGINKPLLKCRRNPRSLSKNRNNVLKYQKAVIDKMYNEFKNKENGISEKAYRRRLSLQYAKIGRHYLRTGDKNQAHENFRLSLGYNPFHMRAIRYYVCTLIRKQAKDVL